VAVLVVLLALVTWVATRKSNAVKLSGTISLGMHRDEVESILGTPALQLDSAEESTLLYGSSAIPFQIMASVDHAFDTETAADSFDIKAWPVRVSIDHYERRVIRIERGDEVEE